jgi:putative ABC transport system permease protein
LDQLILTPTESVWEIHHHEDESEVHEKHEEIHDHVAEDELDHHDANGHEQGPDITAMLIQFRNPMGLVQLPRMVNENTNMQAAVPAYEINRLFNLMGIGIETINSIALVIMVVAGLSVFISLYSALKKRRYEMALMRCYGSSRWQLVWLVLQEGLLLTLIGFLLGIFSSRIGLRIISRLMEADYHYSLSGLMWLQEEFWLLVTTVTIGLLASLLPAINAFYINISKTLADA